MHISGGRMSRARWTTAVVALLGVLAAALTVPELQSDAARAATSGVSLLPAAGQFTPLSGTAVLDTRNGTGVANPSLTAGSTLTFSVRSVGGVSTGVPADASAVVLELNALGNFTGVLSGGSAAGATDTSLTFPANVERNGFDIVTPAADGTVALAITGFSPIPSGAVMSKIVVRLHGYYSGDSTTTAGSTYVGFSPTALADTTASPSGVSLNGSPTSGPLTIGTPPGGSGSNAYNLQVTGNAGVPADGSATAVALQVIVQNPTCSGGFALVPAGSGRTDYDGSFTAGENDENFDLVALPTSGQVTLRLLGCSGTATVIVRVRGYFSAPSSSTPGSSFVPGRQTVFDSANSVGTANCAATSDSPQIAAHSGCAIPVLGVGDFPSSGVSGIAAEVVAVNPAHDGWLGLYSDSGQAHTATLWYSPGGRTSNFEIATYTNVSDDGTVYVWNGGGYPVNVVVRAHGYEQAPSAPLTPANVWATAQGGSTVVTWEPPPSDGGAAVTGYSVLVDGQVVTQTSALTATIPVDGSSPHAIAVRGQTEVGSSGLAMASAPGDELLPFSAVGGPDYYTDPMAAPASWRADIAQAAATGQTAVFDSTGRVTYVAPDAPLPDSLYTSEPDAYGVAGSGNDSTVVSGDPADVDANADAYAAAHPDETPPVDAASLDSDAPSPDGTAISAEPDSNAVPDQSAETPDGYRLPKGIKRTRWRWDQTDPYREGIYNRRTGDILAEVDVKWTENITGTTSDWWWFTPHLRQNKGGKYEVDMWYACGLNIHQASDHYCHNFEYPNGTIDGAWPANTQVIHRMGNGNVVDATLSSHFGHHFTPPPHGNDWVIKYPLLRGYMTWNDWPGAPNVFRLRGWDVCVARTSFYVQLCADTGKGG